MEYVAFIIASLVFVLMIFALEGSRARKEEKEYVKKLYKNYGELSDKKYALERFARMGSYFERHSEPGQIDDITWNDLGMDEIFKRMNYTLSAAGEEYLYYTLRTPRRDQQKLEHMDEVVRFFGEHPDVRVQVQLKMRKLGYTGKYSLYDYLDNLDYLGERSNARNLIFDLLFLPFIAMLWINFSVGILGIVGLMLYNIVSYFKEKGVIDPYITSFAYIMRLLDVCDELEKISVPVCVNELQDIKNHRKQLQGMRRNSFWVMSPTRGNSAGTSGDIISVFMDYIRMVFHVDLIKFNSMLKNLRGHIEDVDALIGIVCYLETSIAIWIFRESLENRYCLPEFVQEEQLQMNNGYHPLLENPVKNSISTKRGVLLTGSNASGKSTFLKTVAVNVILAQSIDTCVADSYRAPLFYIYSSMALRDDIGAGESYYIVEIKALKRILDASAEGKSPIICFVDEVLRGTNTVERIAASTQILKSLSSSQILCFAATHDIELTQLLEGDYNNYHFEEDVRDGDVFFNYKLQKGKAVTRNAIRLLELMGYRKEIIDKATAQAENFVRTGHWT